MHIGDDMVQFKGRFTPGAGHAHEVFATDSRKKLMRSVFGCEMFGTFNVHITNDAMKHILAFEPSYRAEEGDVNWRFYLCEIRDDRDVKIPAWIIHWMGPNKNKVVGMIEIISKQRLPEAFRESSLNFQVFAPWTKQKIADWVAPQTKSDFFQSFTWGPQRADSRFVWDAIRPLCEWEGRTVLDIGPHTGYFAYMASKEGAAVSTFEPDKRVRERMITIGHHIEKQDVRHFLKDPKVGFDIILFLSVMHQIDKTYGTLFTRLYELKQRCRDLFVELIVPPLAGGMTVEDVNGAVGEKHIVEYQHKVRCTRRIYHLKGEK